MWPTYEKIDEFGDAVEIQQNGMSGNQDYFWIHRDSGFNFSSFGFQIQFLKKLI